MKNARPLALHVEVLWEDTVLRVLDLAPPRPFAIGVDPAACDVVVPAEALGAERRAIVHAREGGELALDPSGATGGFVRAAEDASALEIDGGARLPIARGLAATLRFGAIEVRLACADALPKPPRARFDRRRATMIGVSTLAHAGALLFAACLPGESLDHDANGVSAEQLREMQLVLARADAKEMEELAADVDVSEREGGMGTRARAEEGSMGNPSTRPTDSRYGVAGPPADPHLARRSAADEAAEFGMIGLLNSGSGGDPNAATAPWGRDDSLGNDPLSARGNAWGDAIGNGVGSGHAGLKGTGPGGGGIGLVGIGTLGHGAPAGAATNVPPSAATNAPPSAVEAPPARPTIDANGRFATTYRPGGGHLAAFESAVARGIVPEGARELVSDVGARYAPLVDAPIEHALALRADLERSALAPTGGAVHLRIALRSAIEAPKRPHLSVHLVLDVSGSMQGESITRARSAAAALVDKLQDGDDFSMTTFSNDATVVVPDEPLAGNRDSIKRSIERVSADGGTNIWAGLHAGYAEAERANAGDDAVKVVLLVSDGRANGGVTATPALSKLALQAFQKGIQTSSFGLGSDYDGALMSAVAGDGAGGYYYLARPDQIAPALATEIDKRLDPVATAVELRVRLKRGVDLTKVYGSRRLEAAEASAVRAQEVAADRQAKKRDHIAEDRQDDAEGGMRFFFPAFARDDLHAALFEIALPAGVGDKDIATIELKYKDRLHHDNETLEQRVAIKYANDDAASAATIDPSVARTVQGFAAGETLLRAATLIQAGNRERAATILSEREGILRQAAATLREPLFLKDADRLARLRGEARENADSDDKALVLSMLLETAGNAHLR